MSLKSRVSELYAGGFEGTADEAARKLHRSVLAVRPRVAELHKAGRLKFSGAVRKNRSGKEATVWVALH
jgi:hypothetical protein